MKLIEKLSTYAALLGVIGAIGGGFYTWGQFNSRLDAIEATPAVDLSSLHAKDKEISKKVDEALLYANEYKVDLIDRIKKVDDKIVPVDLTKVFKEIGKVREQMAMIDIPEAADLTPISNAIKGLESALSELSQQVAIALKENELQDIQIKEIKASSSNPLSK
jgi:hypothetical protein|tara:strand:+ start:280 stop:768 length:489 start_codon:yes stop_codon:yes gene_type:complete